MVKSILSYKYIILLSRLILGVVFIVASIEKIAQPELFASSILAYKLLPLVMVNIAALVIPWLELVCGITMMVGAKIRAASVIFFILLVVFIVAIISAIVRGLTIDCGCFGAMVDSPVSWLRVVEDIGLVLLCLHLYFFSSQTVLEKHKGE